MALTDEDKNWISTQRADDRKWMTEQLADDRKWMTEQLADDRKWMTDQLADVRKWMTQQLADDRHWMTQQLEIVSAKMEHVETTLLTEFHKWASPAEMRLRSHRAAIRTLDIEVEVLADRVTKLEHPPS